jgi:hypothetical protein
MIGGPPMMMMPQPGFAPGLPAAGMPPPGFANPPRYAQAPMAGPQPRPSYPLPQQPAAPYPGLAQQPLPNSPAAPPRVVRGQMPEEPVPPARPVVTEARPAPLRLPAPEELGVGGAAPASRASADGATAHQRLDQLGATCLHVEKLPQGGCRLTCLLATSQQGRSHRIDVQAADSAEALRLAVEKAEAWAARR